MAVSTTTGTNWGTWLNLEGSIYSEPAPTLHADDRINVFVRGGSDSLWSRGQNRDRTWAAWSGYSGASCAGVPSAIRGKDGKIRTFFRTTGGDLAYVAQTAINATTYTAPATIVTGVGGDPAAALNADGRIQVFFRGADGALWSVRNQGLRYELYDNPVSHGGTITATPSPILDGSGRIVVAVQGGSQTLWTIQQQSENSTAWETWESETTGVSSRPSVVLDAAARVQILYRGSDAAAWRVGQTDDYDSFVTSVSIGGAIIDRPTGALGQDGRINVFVKGTDSALWVAVQDAENSTTYETFKSLGGGLGDVNVPVAIADQQNLLNVFVQGAGSVRNLWTIPQVWV